MDFEQSVDNAINSFASWAWQCEIILGIVCAIVCIIVGIRFLKKKKKNAGYIWLGVGGLILILDVVKAFFELLL